MSEAQRNSSSSHSRKVLPEHARPSKPPVMTRRGHSYGLGRGHGQQSSHGHVRAQSAHSSAKLGPGWSKKLAGYVASQPESDDDFTDFLQYCATCERQITNPMSSGLYCSEACRRQDDVKPTPLYTPAPSSATTAQSYFDIPTADIVSQRSPTILRPRSNDFSEVYLSDSDEASLDESDPEPRDSDDAAGYLSQFRSLSFAYDHEPMLKRPRCARALTTTASSTALPSLSTTPSSSIGTAASYTADRPLVPPRSTPWSAVSAVKSVDLVTPLPITAPSSMAETNDTSSLKSSASTLTSFRFAEGSGLSYDKRRPSLKALDQRRGSLKQLFRHDAMQAPPEEPPI